MLLTVTSTCRIEKPVIICGAFGLTMLQLCQDSKTITANLQLSIGQMSMTLTKTMLCFKSKYVRVKNDSMVHSPCSGSWHREGIAACRVKTSGMLALRRTSGNNSLL